MKKYWFLLLAVYAAFFAIGMPDGAFGVAMPDIRIDVGLSRTEATAIMIVHSIFYALAASQTGRLAARFKLQWVSGGGIFMLLAGILGYAVSPNLTGFVISTAILGAGMSLIDAGANAFAVDRLSPKHMNHLHCFWAMGGAVSPLIMRQMIIYYDWRMGYVAIFAVQWIVAVILIASILSGLWNSKKRRGEAAEDSHIGKFLTARRFKNIQLLIFFLYVAFEQAVTIWTVDVLLGSPQRNVEFETAGLFPTVYLGAIMAGRFGFGYVAEKFSGTTVIRVGFALAATGLVILTASSNILGIALVGLGFAPIFPCLMNETKKRFHPALLSKLVGLQIAASGAGAAIGAFAMGQVLERVSLEAFFPVIIVCVAVVCAMNEYIERAVRKSNCVS